jgi:hypothetical protein
MRVLCCAALLVSGCKIDLDHRTQETTGADAAPMGRICTVSTASVCTTDAPNHSDFTWIQNKIFTNNCGSESCHGSVTASGKLDLSLSHSYVALMGADGLGVQSKIDTSRKLVVPGNPNASYLFIILRAIGLSYAEPPASPPPSNVGWMPMISDPLCCEKMDVIGSWITQGAMNN